MRNPFFAKLKDRLNKEKFSVGLDIGAEFIKLVKLKFNKDTVELCGFELEPLQANAAEVLKKIRQSQNAQEEVNISVSGPSTVIRYAQFPRMNADELKQALKFEAPKHIPFAVSEINLDGSILKEDLQNNKVSVLIAAVKKDFFNQRMKLIEEAGFKANIVDIDSIALVNAFNFNYAPLDNTKYHTIALLNIDTVMANLDILESGFPCLSRDILISEGNLTGQAQDEALVTRLAEQIRTSFDYYESQSASSVAKVFLSGRMSKLPGLDQTLAGLLGVEVEYWDPLRKIILSAGIDAQKAQEASAHLPVAVGLALRQ